MKRNPCRMRLQRAARSLPRRRAFMDSKDDSARPTKPGETRRDFIRKSAAVAAAAASADLLSGSARAQGKGPYPGRVIGANDRIAVAYIGTGNQGTTHVKSQKD